MSTDHDDVIAPSAGGTDDDQDAVETIVDPDDYVLRRRLKQLLDAKERVRETRSNVVRLETMRREFTERKRDRLVAEEVVDYVQELVPVLRKRQQPGAEESTHEEFLNETVSVDGQTDISVAEFVEHRGEHPSRNEPLSYHVSMRVWDTCNRYFEEIAGAEFEQSGLPNDKLQNNRLDSTGR